MFKKSYILLIALGTFLTTSCDKNAEEGLNSPYKPNTSKCCNNELMGGDDDEEEFIIQVQVVNEGSGNPIQGATVDHFRSGASTPDDSETTDSQGLVSFTVEEGDYFEKVTASGFPVFTTPVFAARDTLLVVEL